MGRIAIAVGTGTVFVLLSSVVRDVVAETTLPKVATTDTKGYLSGDLIYSLENRPTPQCHASTIVETPTGLVAAWFGGAHENNPDVSIWVSRHDGKQWKKAEMVVDGSEGEDQDYACWNPVLFQANDGPLMLFYKVGLNPRQWWGALTTSDNGGATWSAPRKLGEAESLGEGNTSLLGPVKNKPIQLTDGTLLCPSSSEHKGWRVHFEVSRDGGSTWKVIGPINDASRFGAIQPSLLSYADGRLQILCRSRQGSIVSSWSSDQGKSWSRLQPLHLPNPNSGTDAVTLQDGRQLLVYNHALRTREQNGRQILNVALSDDGLHWKTVMTLENEGNPAGYSYPAVIQAQDGTVHITYTWRRLSVKHVRLDPTELH